MKCEVEITNLWARFDIDPEYIIDHNRQNGAPQHLLKSFKSIDFPLTRSTEKSKKTFS